MLKSLFIQNFAIIDTLDIQFAEGFTALTGETGAGKSILLGAIGLILGSRADSKSLRNPQEKCIIEVEFLLDNVVTAQLISLFPDLEIGTSISIRREIQPTGKSRLFINDSISTLQEVQSLSPYLVDLHQQYDNLELFQENAQLGYLDITANTLPLVDEYTGKFQAYSKLLKELNELELTKTQNIKEKEFIQFQCNELDELNLKPGELLILEQQVSTANQFTEIKENTAQCLEIFNQENGALQQIFQSIQLLKPFQQHPDLSLIQERLYSLQTDLSDINRTLERFVDTIDDTQFSAEELQTRLNLVHTLMHKHKVKTEQELLDLHESLAKKSYQFEHIDEEIASIQKQINDTAKQLHTIADQLSAKRKKAIPEFEKQIKQSLSNLAMEHAQLHISIESTDQLLAHGKEKIQFLFSANKGLALKPLKNFASGGELSRLNLCIKALIAGKTKLPTLIFDEVDAGVSGQVAKQMGSMISSLAANHQVLVITHSPQVAASAKHHLHIVKDSSGATTTSKIIILNKKERLQEIAKMLSGDPPTANALKNAQELLAF